jgi:hypothetical protein
MIGSGAVVTKSIPPGCFAPGVPAKVISDVEKLMDKVDEVDMQRRVTEVVHDFTDSCSLRRREEKLPDNSLLIMIEHRSLLRKKLYRILVTNAQHFSREAIAELAAKGNFVLISSSDVPIHLEDNLPIWFDLKNLRCGDITDKFAFAI